MIDRLKSLRPGHIKLVVVAILKSLRTSNVLLASVAIVIAAEGAFISWNLYDVRDDVEASKRELLTLREYASTNQELTTAINKFLGTANKELVAIKETLGDIDGNTDRLESYQSAAADYAIQNQTELELIRYYQCQQLIFRICDR